MTTSAFQKKLIRACHLSYDIDTAQKFSDASMKKNGEQQELSEPFGPIDYTDETTALNV